MTTSEIQALIDKWIESYIKQTVGFRPGDKPTATRFNELLNLLINQGDDTAKTVALIRDYLKQYTIEHNLTHTQLTELINQVLAAAQQANDNVTNFTTQLTADMSKLRTDINADVAAKNTQVLADVDAKNATVTEQVTDLSNTVAGYKQETLALVQPLADQVAVDKAQVENMISNAQQVLADSDNIYAAIANKSDKKYSKAAGTATAITLEYVKLEDGFSHNFIATQNNNGAATFINGKPLYKPNTTAAPNLIAGKAYTVWYDATGGCFFLKASAEGDAIAEYVLAGKTFSNDNDTGIVGTATLYDSNMLPLDWSYTYPHLSISLSTGFYDGAVLDIDQQTLTKQYVPTLSSANIKAGITILGETGTFTADATALASDIRVGKNAYVNGSKVVGTLASFCDDFVESRRIIDSHDSQTLIVHPVDTYAGTPREMIVDDLTQVHIPYQELTGLITGLDSANIKAGVNILGVQGSPMVMDTSVGDAVAANIVAGKKACVDGAVITGNIPTVSWRVDATDNYGYGGLDGAGTLLLKVPPHIYVTGTGDTYVRGIDPNFIASNIANGVRIFGITGTMSAGKKFASGTVTVTGGYTWAKFDGGTVSGNGAAVSGLNFTPSVILLWSGTEAYLRPTIYKPNIYVNTLGDKANCSGMDQTFYKEGGSMSVVYGSFLIPALTSVGVVLNWLALE